MKPRSTRDSRGFALVVTISLLVLLVVIATGLLSLSAVTLRGSSQDQARMLAQANARIALQIAIGELQKHAGADTRVTANASIVDEKYPSVLGVWRSWEGTDHESNGRPIPPLYNTKDQAQANGGRFIEWLVSSAANRNVASTVSDPPSLVQTSPGNNNVPLLSTGSLQSTDTRQVHVVPTQVEIGGHYAWWVSGENQKARVAQPYQPRTENVAGLAEMGQSHTITNPNAFGLSSLLDDLELHQPDMAGPKPGRKLLSRQTMALIEADNGTTPERKFHDFSTDATGLLTNTATGGWRKDLSLLTERWDAIYESYPGTKLPLFRYTPTSSASATSQVPKPVLTPGTRSNNTAAVTAATPDQSNLYPWSNYSRIGAIRNNPQPITYQAAAASWQSLVAFATAYKNFTNSSGTPQSPFVWGNIQMTNGDPMVYDIYQYRHSQRLYPQIARLQVLICARSLKTSVTPPDRYRVDLLYCPVITLWNPYNVQLTYQNINTWFTQMKFLWGERSLPGGLAMVDKALYPNPNTVPRAEYRMLTPGGVGYNDINVHGQTDQDINSTSGLFPNSAILTSLNQVLMLPPTGTMVFKPGETKVYSLSSPLNYTNQPDIRLPLQEGYNNLSNGIIRTNYKSNIPSNQNCMFVYDPSSVTKPYASMSQGRGFFLSIFSGDPSPTPTNAHTIAVMHQSVALVPEIEGNNYWPSSEVDEVTYTPPELASTWTPLFSFSMGLRTSIGTPVGTEQNRPIKGVLQSNSLSSMSMADPANRDSKVHPANANFDMTFHSLPFGSTLTPPVTTSKGYIGTGYQIGDGLSRFITTNLPLRPIASLVELEGWNPRGNNPYPPFQSNVIGNGDAIPMIPKNQVVPPQLSPNTIATNLIHDDAYCANHLLFDDWFVSSIAPDPYDFGGQTISKDINTVYRDFLTGESRLPNRSYLPISEDRSVSDTEAAARIARVITSPDGWIKVASRFEVEGMFNVNSTSVDAWKALLGHAKSLDQIAMHGANGIEAKDVSDKHVVTRSPVATDIEAGTGAAFSGQFADASEYTGFRTLNDAQIEDLAKKVVEQVRLRGPFLSLSEFVNRQLSDDATLALAGAVQSAINNLADDPMAWLRDPLNKLSDNTIDPGDPKIAGVDYAFPDAAKGSSAYGAPGWIRQADVLRPIAPVLTVRDDTFTIRTYGDATDRKGNVIAKAWCEAVVKRTRDFTDSSDAADSVDAPGNNMNVTFGRRFVIVSFRWLTSNEV